jgi:hypothetical protein
MSTLDLSLLEHYIGADIVKDLVAENRKKHEKSNRTFMHLDVSKDTLPHVDLILCRDLFLHIKYEDIFKILRNFKKNNARYVLLSTYAETTKNVDRQNINAGFRPLNLELPPFNFPKPLLLIEDSVFYKKYIGLWELSSIPTN